MFVWVARPFGSSERTAVRKDRDAPPALALVALQRADQLREGGEPLEHHVVDRGLDLPGAGRCTEGQQPERRCEAGEAQSAMDVAGVDPIDAPHPSSREIEVLVAEHRDLRSVAPLAAECRRGA